MTKTVVAVGEALWDLLPDGAVLGGAPCNFAYRVHSLGGCAALVSCLGNDELGDSALNQIESLGFETRYIQRDPDHPTGTVKIEFDQNQQPIYEIVRPVAYDFMQPTNELMDFMRSCAALCFGTLTQRNLESRQTIQAMLDACEQNGGAIRLFDINLRKDCYSDETIVGSLKRADVLKLNEDEAHSVASILAIDSPDPVEIAKRLFTQFPIQHCLVTLGERGALCISREGETIYEPGYEVTLVDPCGSGDAFSAGFILPFLRKRPLQECCRLGNVLGAIVATQRGATVAISPEQALHFYHNAPRRICEPRFGCYAIQLEGKEPWTI